MSHWHKEMMVVSDYNESVVVYGHICFLYFRALRYCGSSCNL